MVGQWEGGGTHTGAAFRDLLIGSLPAGTGRTMCFTGTTVLKVENGLITEELGLDDGVTALTQLGLIPGRGVEDVHNAPDPDSAESLANHNPVEKVSPGTTADAPAVIPGLISTDPTLSDNS